MTYTNGAGGNGHSAIAFQDSSDVWWFMSFEPLYGGVTDIRAHLFELRDIEWNDSKNMITNANFYRLTLAGQDIVTNYYNSTFDSKTRTHVHDRTISIYDSQVYITGDFSKSYDMAQVYNSNAPNYNLIGRNCSWLALEVLQASTMGDTWDRLERYLWQPFFQGVSYTPGKGYWGPQLRRVIIPNNSVDHINRLFG